MNLTNHDIEALLTLCRDQHQGAQMEVYNRYYKAMYNTALRIVKDVAEAEDVMQDSFLSAFTKLDGFNAEATFGSWLKRIVVNNSINALRKRERLKEEPLDRTLYKIEDDPFRESEIAIDTSFLTVDKVIEVMAQLKESYRISLNLHLIEGYDYEEMGNLLDMSYANCRTTVSRAKESLRKKLLAPEK